MTFNDLYDCCTRLHPDEVRARLVGLDDVPGPEVRRVYAALGCRTRLTVAGMRRAIRLAIIERMGAYHRVHA